VVMLLTYGGAGGGQADSDDGWWLERRRERERKMVGKLGGKLIFLFLHPIFFLLSPCNPPLFIGGGRGMFRLY